jgi:hypothetical protein
MENVEVPRNTNGDCVPLMAKDDEKNSPVTCTSPRSTAYTARATSGVNNRDGENVLREKRARLSEQVKGRPESFRKLTHQEHKFATAEPLTSVPTAMRWGDQIMRELTQVLAVHRKVEELATIAAGVDGTPQSRFTDRSLKKEEVNQRHGKHIPAGTHSQGCQAGEAREDTARDRRNLVVI